MENNQQLQENQNIEPQLAQNPEQLNVPDKMFRYRDVVAGSIVGGPFAAAYFFYKNFKISGNIKPAKIALFSFIIGVPALLLVLAIILPQSIPRAAFTGLYVGLITFAAQKYMKPLTDYYEHMKGEFRSANRATLNTVIFLVAYIVMFFGGFWAYFRTIDNTITLGDTFSLIVLGEKFDSKTYLQYVDEFTSNDSKALAEFERVSSTTDNPREIEKSVDSALQLYTANKDLITKIQELKPFPTPIQKEVDYLTEYNSLRIEYFTYIRAATKDSDIGPNNANIIKANQVVSRIDALAAKQPKRDTK